MPTFSTTAATVAGEILQDDLLPGIQAQLNEATILADRLKRVPSHNFKGNVVELVAHKSRGVTHNIDEATETMPPRSIQGWETIQFNVRKLGQRIGVGSFGLERTRNAPDGAFVELLKAEMDGARRDLAQEQNRQWMGDSSGILGTSALFATATTGVTVSDSRFFRVGAPVALLTTGSTQVVSATEFGTIADIPSGTKIALKATVSSDAVIDIYHRRGATTAIKDEDQFGLASVVDTANPAAGNFGLVDRTAAGKRFWQGNRLTATTNRNLTTKRMKHALNLAERNAGDGGPDGASGITLILASDGSLLEYGSIIVADKRYTSDPFVTLDGGWTGLTFSGIPMIADKDAPPGILRFINEPDLMIAETAPVRFEDKGAGPLFMLADTHIFQALLFVYRQLTARRCKSHVSLENIIEDLTTYDINNN